MTNVQVRMTKEAGFTGRPTISDVSFVIVSFLAHSSFVIGHN